MATRKDSKPLKEAFLQQALRVLQQTSELLPPSLRTIDWSESKAALWQYHPLGSSLVTYDQISTIAFEDLLAIERQKAALDLNTRQFLAELPANNALLWGARGSGKSSLVHALLNRYAKEGLRLIQLSKDDFRSLHKIIDLVKDKPYRFILYYDDLSFDDRDASYKLLKSALEGSIFVGTANVIIYATSNRRHLLSESIQDNQNTVVDSDEIHPGEAVEEKLSLSDRFGLWLPFRLFRQDDYLSIAEYWITALAQGDSVKFDQAARQEALRWALRRGSRSGRTAYHFARHWVGKQLLQDHQPAELSINSL